MYIRTALCLVFLALSVAMLFTLPTQHSLSSQHISTQANLPLDCVPNNTPQATATPINTPSQANHVVLNEVLLQSQKPAYHCSDVSQEISPWIELYNPLHQSTSLPDAYILLNNSTVPFVLPANTTIPAEGFSILFLPTGSVAKNASTHIQLFSNGELIDQVTVPPLKVDTSYARIPDGGAWYITTSPTIATGNTLTTIPQKKPTRTPTKHRTTHPKQSTHPSPALQNQKNSSSATQKTNSAASSSAATSMAQQPQWKNLHLTEPVPSRHIDSNTVHSTPSIPVISHPSIDIPQKILVTALLIALLLSLGWCIRLFFLT